MTPNDFERIFDTLVRNGVEFVIVGGIAATLHGSARMTQDLDFVYRRTRENMERLVTALVPLQPSLLGAPKDLPFRFDAHTIRAGLNFTFTTDWGDVDCLGEVSGIGGYPEALARSVEVTLFGLPLRFLNLDALIDSKRADGRRKDLEAIAELEVIREERDKLTS